MVYLTNDALDHVVYFELRGREARKKGNGREELLFGLLGNGVHEVSVTLKSVSGRVEVAFGKSELFRFVEEDAVRRMLGEMMSGETMH